MMNSLLELSVDLLLQARDDAFYITLFF